MEQNPFVISGIISCTTRVEGRTLPNMPRLLYVVQARYPIWLLAVPCQDLSGSQVLWPASCPPVASALIFFFPLAVAFFGKLFSCFSLLEMRADFGNLPYLATVGHGV